MTYQEIKRIVEEKSIQTIDIKLTNLFGGLHHITLPVSRLNENLFKNGIGIDGSSIPGFKTKGRSDASLIPDMSTGFIDPFWDSPTLSFIGGVFFAGTDTPYPLDPRQTAIRAHNYLKESGIADRSMWGPELEFHIFNSVRWANTVNSSSYRIDSSEADWTTCEFCDTPTPYPIAHQSGYHAAPPRDKYYKVREQMVKILTDMNVPVKYHHHEVGGSGQCEIEIELVPMLSGADAIVLIKYVSKMVACQNDLVVTYMPKPLYNEAGNGMHFHQHLFQGNKPVFYDENGYEGLSKNALYYIGGLLYHGSAILAITNPSTNSYKRLVPGFEAPVRAMFGIGNRSAAVRVPKYATQPDKKRIEFRPSDATTNGYLAMAAQMMAGIDGIKNKIDPVELGYGPFDEDVMALPEEKRNKIPQLPTTLSHALMALEKDHEFLLQGDVFSKNMIENWINWKMEREVIELRNRPHPYEVELYFDV